MGIIRDGPPSSSSSSSLSLFLLFDVLFLMAVADDGASPPEGCALVTVGGSSSSDVIGSTMTLVYILFTEREVGKLSGSRGLLCLTAEMSFVP